MEEPHRANCVCVRGEEGALQGGPMPSPGTPPSQLLVCSPTQKLFEPHPLEVFMEVP